MARTRETYPVPEPEPSFVAEAAVQYGMPQQQLEQALWLAGNLLPEELELAGALSKISHLDRQHRGRLADAMRRTVEEYFTRVEDDPLVDVDDPISAEEQVAATVWANLEAETHRSRLLSECIGAEQAGQLTGRSRQAVERQRRSRQILALRIGRRWRYPAWQFDIDGPGGLVPQLPEVISNLHLSPAGAAYWLTTPRPELGGKTAIQLLRQRNPKAVLNLAQQLSYLP